MYENVLRNGFHWLQVPQTWRVAFLGVFIGVVILLFQMLPREAQKKNPCNVGINLPNIGGCNCSGLTLLVVLKVM